MSHQRFTSVASAVPSHPHVRVRQGWGQIANASQNNPWNVAQGSNRPGPRRSSDVKESLYASVGAVLTQYQLDVKDSHADSAKLGHPASRRSVCVASRPITACFTSHGAQARTIVRSANKGISSFRIDKKTGALAEFGTPVTAAETSRAYRDRQRGAIPARGAQQPAGGRDGVDDQRVTARSVQKYRSRASPTAASMRTRSSWTRSIGWPFSRRAATCRPKRRRASKSPGR